MNLTIQPLMEDQAADAKTLILNGLSDYFDEINHLLNRDVYALYETFSLSRNLFLIGMIQNKIIATGGLLEEQGQIARIVRMSVAHPFRNNGIATQILASLENEAKQMGYRQIVLETNEDWNKAVRLYEKHGYHETYRKTGEIHFNKILRC